MAKNKLRVCPQCQQKKSFRSDQLTCGCKKLSTKPAETNEINGDTWTVTLPNTSIHTLDQLISYFEIDLSVWEVEKFVANKWEAYAGNEKVMPMYQVKAFLKKKVHAVFARNEIAELIALAKKGIPARPAHVHKMDKTGNMLEINLIDHHFGKMAWQVETGHPNYDIHIAEQLFWRGLNAIIERTKSYIFEKIFFVVGNDLFNSDDVQGRTTSGTQVSTDARFHKVFATVRTCIIRALEILRKIAPVEVVMISGNHDSLSVWHLGDSLECYFHNYTDVKIDNSPLYYKYYEFGKVMLMYTHGDKGKKKDYPLMMATEQPDMFGRTRYREVHTGHVHTETANEFHGVVVRSLSPLCPPDRWHAENGYVGNIRRTQAFVWNKSEGLIGIVIYTDSDENIEKATELK